LDSRDFVKIVFATRNANKVKEVVALLPPGFTMFTMDEAGVGADIPETGSTISENSILKAKHVYELLTPAHGICVVAEDSGLEVDALNGAPGVFSARYAGTGNDADNNRKLLEELRNATDRKARFVTVIALIHNGEIDLFEGEISGTIAYEPRGATGFGYDPLFIPTGYRSTFAELGMEVKNKISHRSIATSKLINHLRTPTFR
jgi:XTP/dITP diphosphohydrolase